MIQQLALHVYFNGKRIRVTIARDATVAMSYAVHDLNNLESREGGSSNEFRAPIDANRELDAFWDSQSGSSLPYTLLPAELESRGVSIPCGGAVFTTTAADLNVRLLAGNANLFTKIKGKKLPDLDLSAWDTPIVSQGPRSGFGADYTWLPIETGLTIDRPLVGDKAIFGENELTLCIFAKSLLIWLVEQAGFTLQGSFLDDVDFAELILPQSTTLKLRESYTLANSSRAEKTSNQAMIYEPGQPEELKDERITFPVATEDPEGNWNTSTHEYTAPHRGDFKVKVRLRYNWNSTVGINPRIAIKNGSTEIAVGNITQRGNGLVYELEGSTTGITGTLHVEMRHSNLDAITLLAESYIEVTMLERAYPGAPLHLDANLPNMGQADFVKALMVKFNLLLETRQDGTCTLERFADMVTKTPVDWTNKIDLSTLPETEYQLEDYAQANHLLYSEDADQATEDFSLEPKDRKPGLQTWHTFPVANTTLEEEREAHKSPFAPTGTLLSFDEARRIPLVPLFDLEGKRVHVLTEGGVYPAGDYVFYAGYYYSVSIGFTYAAATFTVTSEWILEAGEALPRAYGVQQPGKVANIRPRLLFRKPLEAGYYYMDNVGATTQLTHGATFDGLDWPALHAKHYGPMTAILSAVQVTRPLLRLTAPDVQDLPFLRPVWIGPVTVKGHTFFNGLYYLNAIPEHYPGTDASSQGVLIKLNL